MPDNQDNAPKNLGKHNIKSGHFLNINQLHSVQLTSWQIEPWNYESILFEC